jgi:IS1 family transposase
MSPEEEYGKALKIVYEFHKINKKEFESICVILQRLNAAYNTSQYDVYNKFMGQSADSANRLAGLNGGDKDDRMASTVRNNP